MATKTIFHGNELEAFELLNILKSNCTCERRSEILTYKCASCGILYDQREMDGLLFARRYLSSRLIEEEFKIF